jgi:hypothetical protein
MSPSCPGTKKLMAACSVAAVFTVLPRRLLLLAMAVFLSWGWGERGR